MQPSPSTQALDLQQLTTIVSEITRFPVDLLQPDIDFEDELGIDSLKQAEIAAVLADRLGLPRDQGSFVADTRTIRQLHARLHEVVANPGVLTVERPEPPDRASLASVGLPEAEPNPMRAERSRPPDSSPVPPVVSPAGAADETLARIRALVGHAGPGPAPEFAGKVAFITGSGRGLGRVTACELARRGATVIVNSFHNRDAGEQTKAMIESAGGTAIHLWGSVAQPAHMDEIFASIDQHFGGLDFFVHNASDGIFATLDQAREKDWLRSFRTNVLGFQHGAMSAAKLMRPRHGGKILSISAVYEELTVDYFGVQGPVKAALESLTRFVAKELLSDNIQVNCIALGALEGNIMNAYPESERIIAMTEARSQGHRRCTELEAAQAQAFLLSSAADSITGTVLRMDRGMSIA